MKALFRFGSLVGLLLLISPMGRMDAAVAAGARTPAKSLESNTEVFQYSDCSDDIRDALQKSGALDKTQTCQLIRNTSTGQMQIVIGSGGLSAETSVIPGQHGPPSTDPAFSSAFAPETSQ